MHNKTLAELSAALQQGDVSSEELTKHFLQRIQSLDSKLNALVTITEEQALAQARQADEQRKAGNAGPMTGVPLPLVSYGGTAILASLAAFGILVNISKQTKY